MKHSLFLVLSWAIVVHALVDGKPQDVVVDVAPNYSACTHEISEQKINGECSEIIQIIHHQAI